MNIETLKALLLTVGAILVILGSGLLLHLGMTVNDILVDPTKVGLVNYIRQNVTVEDSAFYGIIGQQRFEMRMSESVRTISFLLIGSWILSSVAGVTKALLFGGLKIFSVVAEMGKLSRSQDGSCGHNGNNNSNNHRAHCQSETCSQGSSAPVVQNDNLRSY